MNLFYSYTAKKLLKNEEPLPFMHFIVITLRGTSSLFRIFRYGSTAYGTVMNCLQFLALIYEGSGAFHRIPWTCIYLYATSSQISLAFLMDIESLRDLQNELHWSLDSAGNQVKKRILKNGKFIDSLAILAFLLFLMCQPVLRLDEFTKTDFSCVLCRKYLPAFESVHVTILVLWALAASPLFLGWPFTFVYFSWHVQYQLMILAEYVKEISTDFNEYSFPSGLRHNGYYQEIILKRLKFVIKRHGELLRCHRQSLKYYKVKVTGLLLGFCGSTVAVSSCWSIMINDNVMVPVFALSSFLILLEMQGRTSQNLEETFAGIFDAAVQVPWYHWDSNNRKIYSSLVQTSAQMVPCSFFNAHVNREFQVKLLSKVYAMTSLLIDFHI